MDLITSAEVIRRIKLYFAAGRLEYLSGRCRVMLAELPPGDEMSAEPALTAGTCAPDRD